jgi:hypothetical protein
MPRSFLNPPDGPGFTKQPPYRASVPGEAIRREPVSLITGSRALVRSMRDWAPPRQTGGKFVPSAIPPALFRLVPPAALAVLEPNLAISGSGTRRSRKPFRGRFLRRGFESLPLRCVMSEEIPDICLGRYWTAQSQCPAHGSGSASSPLPRSDRISRPGGLGMRWPSRQ